MPTPSRDLSYFTKVNYVIESWARPCIAPWYIYISTLKPALLTAFITLITFGWDDVARGYARPHGLGRRTGKGRGKRRGRFPLRFPELGELIGKELPGSSAAKGAKWSNGLRTLWRIDTVIQGALFFWLVVDVTIDLAYNWTSVLYETRWCQDTGLGRFSYTRTDPQAIPGGFWQTVDYPDKDYEESPVFWIFSAGNTADKDCTVAATVTWEPFFAEPPPTQVGLRIKHSFSEKVFGQTGPEAPEAGGFAKMPVFGQVPSGTVFKIQVWHNAAAAIYADGFVTCVVNE